MNELNKIVLIFLSVVVISQTVGTGSHEGTHWVQGVLDDRIEPVSIKIYPDCDGAPACVIHRWTTDNTDEREAWRSGIPNRERGALFVDVSSTSLFVLAGLRKGWL